MVEEITNGNLIKVSGAYIKKDGDFWSLLHSQLNLPAERKIIEKQADKSNSKVDARVEAGVPLALKGSTGIAFEAGREKSSEEQSTWRSEDSISVAREISSQGIVVFVDDFHYIPEDLQSTVAQQIKDAALTHKIKFCVAQVAHSPDVIIRRNNEAIGRMVKIDFSLWAEPDLLKIANLGYEFLGVRVSDSIKNAFVVESAGSPQLMQEFCLALCNSAKYKAVDNNGLISMSLDEISSVISSCIRYVDKKSLLDVMEVGPVVKGQARNSYVLIDGESVDVYGAIISAIALNPPWLKITKNQLIDRISFLINGDNPTSTSISNSLGHLVDIANKHVKAEVVSWSDEQGLYIVDPYLLFYIRWSKKYRSRRAFYEVRKKSIKIN